MTEFSLYPTGSAVPYRDDDATCCAVQDEAARQEAYPNLPEPHRIKGIAGKKIKFVASGSAAAHVMCIDMEGTLMTWGRNEVRIHCCGLVC